MKIKITADSTCDLSQEILDAHEISTMALTAIIGGVPYKDNGEVMPKDIFHHVDVENGTCSTAAVSVGDYIDAFAAHLQTHDAIIHLNIGSEFSACYQNACLAADEFENVYVVDSQNVSQGTGMLAMLAATLAEEGQTPEAIVEALEEKVKKVETSLVLDSLKYVHKGGRCSALQAMGANLLRLKPCLEVQLGKLDVAKKYRGTFEQVLPQYIKDRLTNRLDIDRKVGHLVHAAGVVASVVEAARQEVVRLGVFDKVIVGEAGCAISCHSGPLMMGMTYFRK